MYFLFLRPFFFFFSPFPVLLRFSKGLPHSSAFYSVAKACPCRLINDYYHHNNNTRKKKVLAQHLQSSFTFTLCLLLLVTLYTTGPGIAEVVTGGDRAVQRVASFWQRERQQERGDGRS